MPSWGRDREPTLTSPIIIHFLLKKSVKWKSGANFQQVTNLDRRRQSLQQFLHFG